MEVNSHRQGFKVGDKVKPSKSFPFCGKGKPKPEVGIVVGLTWDKDCVKVLWNHRKNASSYHIKFLDKIEKED